VGELKIKALHARAQTALGERFDIRRFHNALIDDAPLPLSVLEQRIDEWIARNQKLSNDVGRLAATAGIGASLEAELIRRGDDVAVPGRSAALTKHDDARRIIGPPWGRIRSW
jgi:hypothetical protein